MASYPPPAPGQPFNFDPRQQARFARQQYKAQARAAILAAKAQRDLYRYQNRTHRRSSLLAPLLVLATGIVFLLIRLGRIPAAAFWNWYAQWWPLLLVAAGLILVAEWAWDQYLAQRPDQHPGQPTSPDGRPLAPRGFSAGAALLLTLVAITGAVAHGIQHGRDFLVHNFSFNPDTFDEFFGNKHEMSQPLEADFPPGTSLSIDNPHGDIAIVGKSDDNKIHIIVNKEVWTRSDSDADAKAQQLNAQLTRTGSILSLTVPWLSGATSNFNITLPDFAEVNVNANHGDVNVSGMKARVNVTANHGDVDLASITGAVSAHINNHTGSFVAHGITGDVTLRGHADDLTVTDVSGQTSLEGDFYGDTHLEHLRGPMNFHTNRTQFSLSRLDGAVDISPNADLTATELVGPTTLRTRSRNITFDRVTGPVDVTNSNGSVDLTGASPLGDVSIENKNGEVNINLPERTGFTIDAQTKGGEIENDLDLKSSTENDRSAVQGNIGAGGPKITIRTTHLNIGIHARPAQPLAPMPPPAPPAHPLPPPTHGQRTIPSPPAPPTLPRI